MGGLWFAFPQETNSAISNKREKTHNQYEEILPMLQTVWRQMCFLMSPLAQEEKCQVFAWSSGFILIHHLKGTASSLILPNQGPDLHRITMQSGWLFRKSITVMLEYVIINTLKIYTGLLSPRWALPIHRSSYQ